MYKPATVILLVALALLFGLVMVVLIGALQASAEYPNCSFITTIGKGEYAYPAPAVDVTGSPAECVIPGPTSTPIDWPPPTNTPQATSTPLQPFLICHNPGPRQETILIDAPAWSAHDRHHDEGGYDYIGACVDWYPG